ncbi:MAG: hypothetical protein FJ395_14580 [Verrucomicrobia bacterium]|nr:hypothetical protein [Verrucomicrobiota bacterium]
MSEILFICVIALLVIAVLLELLQFRRNATVDVPRFQQSFETIEKSQQMLDRSIKDEIARGREETRLSLAEQRHALQTMSDSLNQTFTEMRSGLEKTLDAVQQENASKLDQLRRDFTGQTQTMRQEIAATLKEFNQSLAKNLVEGAQAQQAQLDAFAARADKQAAASDKKLDAIRADVEAKLKSAQDAAARQLEQIKAGVDAKLQGTEKRLGDSFQQFEKQLASRGNTGTAS